MGLHPEKQVVYVKKFALTKTLGKLNHQIYGH